MEEIKKEEIKEIEVKTAPLSTIDKKLEEKLAEEIVNQSSLMDDIGKQLITLELAIPGIYATALKLTTQDATASYGGIFLFLTFLLWFIALMFTFFAIFPAEYRVDTKRLDSIEDFFSKSARYKRKKLMISAFIFFAGVITSIFTIS